MVSERELNLADIWNESLPFALREVEVEAIDGAGNSMKSVEAHLLDNQVENISSSNSSVRRSREVTDSLLMRAQRTIEFLPAVGDDRKRQERIGRNDHIASGIEPRPL